MSNATASRSEAAGREIENAAGSGAFQSMEPGGVEPPATDESQSGSLPQAAGNPSDKRLLAEAIHTLADDLGAARRQVADIPQGVRAVPWMAGEILRLRAQLARLAADSDAAIVAEIVGSFGGHQLDKRGCLGVGWPLGRALTWGDPMPAWCADVIRRATEAGDEARRERLAMAQVEREVVDIMSFFAGCTS
jgi:hypothetical protein